MRSSGAPGDRFRLLARRAGGVLVFLGLLLLAFPAGHRAAGVLAQAEARAEGSGSALRDGEAIGRIAIPRLRLDYAVFEGTSAAALRKGPGHLAGTAWPGMTDPGNCVIAGHRDSFFRGLAHARKGDVVNLTGPSGTRSFRLVESRVVSPKKTDAIAPTDDERLTLVSCYPFTWTGPAPRRIVWTARPLSPAAPAAGGETPDPGNLAASRGRR
jgi:sortase A